MMKNQINLLNTLKKSGFVQVARLEENSISIKFNENAIKLKSELEQYWRSTKYKDFHLQNELVLQKYKMIKTPKKISVGSPFDFINSSSLNETIKRVSKINETYDVNLIFQYKIDKPLAEKSAIVDLNLKRNIFLIRDFIVNNEKALENFYNIQRARKIWWMRLSANPSRYLLRPYKLENEELNIVPSGSQSISIESKFHFADIPMEELSLLPLRDVPQGNLDTTCSVIRSTINLDFSTCALLLDACDHNRENLLLLNRKLAPYQCAITYCYEDKNKKFFQALALHLSYVIKNAGLRLYNECNKSKDDYFKETDVNGIPYTLILLETTLTNGLLKLRNRDTSLEETIHISDIPNYLLNIFK